MRDQFVISVLKQREIRTNGDGVALVHAVRYEFVPASALAFVDGTAVKGLLASVVSELAKLALQELICGFKIWS